MSSSIEKKKKKLIMDSIKTKNVLDGTWASDQFGGSKTNSKL